LPGAKSPVSDTILTLNAGSSSIKFALFQGAGKRVAAGAVENIGSAPRFFVKGGDGAQIFNRRWADGALTHEDLLAPVLDWVETHLGRDELVAAGHRIVHGGETFFAPVRLDAEKLLELARLNPLAPLHEPHNLAAVAAVMKLRPELPQIGCFDTSFHHKMPAVATRLAIPAALRKSGMRRYGFHGLSYEYISGALRDCAPGLASGKVVAAHLGAGASACAILDGKSIDSSMGFTGLDGLIMATRCGIIDAGAVLYLLQARGMSADEVSDVLYRQSGLLGLSGVSSDMRVLLESAAPAAVAAVESFTYAAARQIAGLCVPLNGMDGLVFTAGIGEHAPAVRAGICARLHWLGVELDHAANEVNAAVISTAHSRVEVRVIATDEEAMIARHCFEMLGG
jgi:acetate kinase